MVGMITKSKDSFVVEPCFGLGVFIQSLSEKGFSNVTGYEIDPLSFNLVNPDDFPNYHFHNKDFFTFDDKNVDVFIMNPPYVRQEEISELNTYGISKRFLKEKCSGFSIYSRANLYLYFIARSILLLKDGGELIAIFPNAWLNTKDGAGFYDQLSTFGCVNDLIQVKGYPFEGNPLVDVIILKFTKGGKGGTTKSIISVEDSQIFLSNQDFDNGFVSSNCVTLSSKAIVRRGFTTGGNDIYINPGLSSQDYLIKILSRPKQVTGYSTQGAEYDYLLNIQKGTNLPTDIVEYLNSCRDSILDNNTPKSIFNRIQSEVEWYTTPKPRTGDILFPYIIRSGARFILNDAKLVARDNFYTISTSYSHYLLLALLNNYYVYSQLETLGKTYGNGLLKIQKYDVDRLIIPDPSLLDDKISKALIECAEELVINGSATTLDSITGLLLEYYGIKNIKEYYLNQRNNRLNNGV